MKIHETKKTTIEYLIKRAKSTSMLQESNRKLIKQF